MRHLAPANTLIEPAPPRAEHSHYSNDGAADRASAPYPYLGPAAVLGVEGARVRVRLPTSEETHATMALAFPYAPAEGDSLLVIGRGDSHYVIGVLSGQGKVGLHFQGDVALSATGHLSIEGGESVSVRGEEVRVEARTLKTTADALVQKLTSMYQRVSGLLSVRTKEMETIVDEGTLTRAKSATVLTEETMTINGKQILLG